MQNKINFAINIRKSCAVVLYMVEHLHYSKIHLED